VKFGAAFWIQRTGWPELRDACVEAERAGFESIWLDDHLLCDEGDWHDPKLEGWATLAAVAAVTTRVRLGLLVSANTFRNPGLTAKLATTLDHVSGGRAVLGIGGAWFEREHDAFGIDFASGVGERLDRLDEAVMLLRRLLAGERFSHEGRFYTFHDALCEPRPIQQRLPILVGGSGPKKTLRTTARYADAWNGYGSAERIAATSEILRERCAEEGRPFEDIERTVMMDIVVRDDATEARAAYARVAKAHGLEGAVGSDGSARGLSVGGPPEDVVAFLRPYAAIGIAEVMWIFRDPFDRQTMDSLSAVQDAFSGGTG
jgi:F420-dependent oxidoreductase-like protein